jgi:pimeloyl-ACP methyl ester carboxylesterase
MEKYMIKRLEINGTSISYLEKGEGKLLMFLHGFPDIPQSFNKQIDYFSEKGYRVVAPFMRGYFPSAIPADGKYYTLTLGEDVIELIKALGEQRAILIGHDWGATAAYSAVTLKPDSIEKMVAVSIPRRAFSKALVTNPEQQRKSWYIYFFQTKIAEMAVPFDNYAFIKRLWKDWSNKDWTLPNNHIEEVINTLKNDGVLEAAISYYKCFFDSSKLTQKEIEIQNQLSAQIITVPTLYLHGSADGCIGSELCAGLESNFSNYFEKIVIEGAGHFIHLEKPNVFNHFVSNFLDKQV